MQQSRTALIIFRIHRTCKPPKGVKFYFERAVVSKEGKKELQLIHLPVVGEVISPE